MAEIIDHHNASEIRPFSGVTKYEQRERASIQTSTHNGLLELRKQYTSSLKAQNTLKQKGENPPEIMGEIFSRLLEEVKRGIIEKEIQVREKAKKLSPVLVGEVSSGYNTEPISILPSGKVAIGFKNNRAKDSTEEGGRLRSFSIILSYDEFLQNASGKTTEIGDMILTLRWGKKGNPEVHITKRVSEEKEEVLPVSEKMQSLRKAQLILADLRRKITTDTSPLSEKIFQGKRPRDFELAHMTYASGTDTSNIRYAQVMEDKGRIYSAWGEVSSGSRPLIIVDQRNAKMLFSGSIDVHNVITADPGFQWPENRDKSAYRFQPVINLTWTR